MSESCPICLALLSDRKHRRTHTIIQCSCFTERYAFNIDGRVGSLYDCWIDNIYYSSLDENFITEEVKNTTLECDIITDDTLNDDDLLQILHLDNDLWVSIALGMCPVSPEFASLYDYQLLNDRSVRFLSYHRTDRHTGLLADDEGDIIKKILSTTLRNNKATHIITDVHWGIDFIIALEFPINENSKEIDSILEKVCTYFKTEDTEFLSLPEQEKLNRLTPTIFSRIPEICAFKDCKNLNEMFQSIHQYLFNQKGKIPLLYRLHPVKIPNSNDSLDGKNFIPLDSSVFQSIRKIILQLFNKIKVLQHLFDEIQSSSLPTHLRNRYDKEFDQFRQMKRTYKEIQSELASYTLKLRQGKADHSFEQVRKNPKHKEFNCELETYSEKVRELKNKARFISELENNYGLEYFDVAILEEEEDDQLTLETKLLTFYHQQLTCFLCSSDELINNDQTQHKKLCQQLMDEQKINPSLKIVFADFSYCKLILSEMKLLPTNLEPSTPSITKATSIESKELNILLLGETGIGKSTFINAFVNYLAFESIQKAEENGPIVLIPVSFQMVNDDQSKEYEVKLGEQNDLEEDFNHPDQTSTQYCQSYIFNLRNNIKLRIIDTPGIGDTRGLSQDDKNIQYILSYVNNLSHLNAVCILLKPNISRLQILFRSCLEQIFNFLGPNVHDNIIFCFTSSRLTFFLPGNTTPLLKKMLNDIAAAQTLQLSKANMFCFDSESFRYLAAIKSQVHIQFNDDQKNDFIMSWNKSVSESIRLIYLIQSRPHYQMNTWHSIKHAQIIITSLIRPILETLRNILRNEILSNTKNKQYSIEFQAESVLLPSYLCTSCVFETAEIDIFPIVIHSIHQYRKADEYDQCHRKYNQHFSILYQLKYKSTTSQNRQFNSEVNDIRDSLFQGSILFAHFLLNTVQINEDPFLPWFDLFIQEESFLSSNESSKEVNKELHRQLIQLKDDYQKRLYEIKRKQKQIDLDEIYRWITKIENFEMINRQIDAIRKSQMKMMQNHEHDVSLQYPDIDMSKLLTPSDDS